MTGLNSLAIFAWKVRAVYRDIEVLRDSGYRIEG
jgi:hypothetical protein